MCYVFTCTSRSTRGPTAEAGREQMEEEEGDNVQRTVIWGTNVDMDRINRRLNDFFTTFRENEDDEEPFYLRLMRVVRALLSFPLRML